MSRPGGSRAVLPVVPAWTFAALGVVAAVANANFLLRPLVGSRLDPFSTEISQLSVAGQPASWVFRGADVAAGICATLLAIATVGVTLSFRRVRRIYGLVLAGSLAAFGLGTVASAIVTLSCAVTSRCAATPAESAVQDAVHDGLSAVATLGTVIGCILLLRLRASRASRWAIAGESLLAAAITSLAVLQAVYWLSGMTQGSGGIQRGQVLATSIWLALVGFLLARFAGGAAWRTPVSRPVRIRPAQLPPVRIRAEATEESPASLRTAGSESAPL